ncbi:hypothetical protein PQX77_011452 [Marasmius sp. AFHP31]|nr:hypothetical protein PQX77_011452 [Marasmius sp. AFHP31]
MTNLRLTTIPNEIWIEIFSYICCSLRGGLYVSKNYIRVGPYTLSHVCRGWREITLTTPLLWSSIYLELYVHHQKDICLLLEAYLKLSAGVGLQVCIKDRPFEPGAEPEALLSLIMQHLPRFRLFRLTIARFQRLWKTPNNPTGPLESTASKMCNLVTLDIVPVQAYTLNISGMIEALWRAPAVKRIRCSADTFNRHDLFLLRTIESLAITYLDANFGHDSGFFSGLEKMRNLRSLYLTLRGINGPSQTIIPELASSSLERLRVEIYGASSMYHPWLETLTLPSLVTMDLVARDGMPHSLLRSLPQLQSVRHFSLSAGNLNPGSIVYLLRSLPNLEACRIVETSTPHWKVQSETCSEAFLTELTSYTFGISPRVFLPNLKSLYIREITPPLSHYHKVAMELLLTTLEASSTRRLTEVRLVFDETSAMVDRAISLRGSRLSTLTLPRNLSARLKALEGKGTKCGVFRYDDEWRWMRVFGLLEHEDTRWDFKEFEEDKG